ncbi:MAG: cytidine/deoxycytidylate deaminase family protein [Opitutales bacterium]
MKEPLVAAESIVARVEAALAESRDRPSWDEYFMATATLFASRSPCERLHVGCVVVSAGLHPNRVIAAGYNGFLPGLSHRSRVRDDHEQATVHAEQNAIADAARRGVSLQGASAYITHFPCINCSKLLIAAGIARIRYRHDYRNDEIAHELLTEAHVDLAQLR